MEHNVKSYQRRLKNGKTITVRAYTRKGKDGKSKKDSASKGASGDELMKLKAKLKKFGELNLSDEERIKYDKQKARVAGWAAKINVQMASQEVKKNDG